MPTPGVPLSEMQRAQQLIARIAPAPASVLILGESRDENARIAEALHRMSDRAVLPFWSIECASLEEARFERDVRAARGGTIFLDEVSELAPPFQWALADALERAADVRIVASARRALDGLVELGDFRGDLLRRIAEITLRVPAVCGGALLDARADAGAAESSGIRGQVQSFERDRIVAALAETGGNQTKAARLLRVSRRTLTNKLNAYAIARPRKDVKRGAISAL